VLLHLYWMPHLLTHNLGENERNMQKRFCHACMLPNVIVGIILWLVMNRCFCWIHHHVACGLCQEITWSQSRDLIFRARIHVSNHVEHERLLCCRKHPNDTKINSDYFVTKRLIPLEQAVFPRGRASYQKPVVVHLDNRSVHTSQASTDWLEEHGMRHMPHLPYSPDLAPTTSTYFLQWKKNSNGFRWLTRTNCLSACKIFWSVLIKENWMAYFRLGCDGFKKQVKAIETTSDDK
jgi:hypothetical protein